MPINDKYSNQPIAGALFILSASLFIALIGTLVKVVSVSLNHEMIVFFRNLFAMLFLLPWVLYNRPEGGLRTRCFRLHFLRSMAGLFSMYCFFYAVGRLHLGEAFLLMATSPLFIPMIAALWIREPVVSKVRVAILVGFIGIALVLKPGPGIFQSAAVIGLGAGVLAAVAMVTIRRMSTTEPAARIVFYFTLISFVASAVPLFWSWQTPKPITLSILALIGMLAVAAQMLLTKGYSLAPAAQVGPFTYAYVVFSTFFGWFFWEEALDVMTWIGAILICCCGIIATHKTASHPVPDVSAESIDDVRTHKREEL